MEPITIGLLALAGGTLLGTVFGGIVGVTVQKTVLTQEGKLRSDLVTAETKLRNAELAHTSLEHNNDQLFETINTLIAERDEFKRKARTHEIKMPTQPQPGSFWEERLFCNKPDKNLRNMRKELKAARLMGVDVKLHITIEGSNLGGASGFAQAIADRWGTNNKTSTKDIGPWEFHGDAQRALDDFETFLRDDDTGLVKGKGNSKKWVDEDSPLAFRVSLEVVEPINPKPPEPQIVEVAVVETVHKIVEVEKPLFISVPEGQEPELCGHTPEEIRALVRDELQRQEAEAEVESLGRLVGTDLKAEKESRARMAQAQAPKRLS